MGYRDTVEVSDLIGKTFTSVEVRGADDTVVFTTEEGEVYRMFHRQDCCESVYVEDVVGDLEDLVGKPIRMAEVSTNSDDPMGKEPYGSFTWTFYKFATMDGYVTIRWYGTSNGYYSERVSFERVT